MASDPPANKRSRTTELEEAEADDVECKNCDTNEGEGGDNNNDSILEPIRPTVLLQSNDYAKSYGEAKPFPHGIIHNFCNEGFLGECERLSFRAFVWICFPLPPHLLMVCSGGYNVMIDTRILNIISHIIFLQKLPPPDDRPLKK